MRAPFVYRVTAVCIFLMGFALHLTNVVIGPDRLVATVFSPQVEIVFAVMMIAAAISGWMSLKRLSSRGLPFGRKGFVAEGLCGRPKS